MLDIREIWKELGIDLERHDELLEALPEVYEEIFLSQENRPERMSYFDEVVADIHGARVRELYEMRQEGKPILGTFCVYVPEEIVLAAGGVCVGLCGGAEFPIPDAEKYLPRDLCPLIKSSFGFLVSRLCPYCQVATVIVGENTCDGKKKMYEIMSEHKDVYVMEMPQVKDEEGLEYWHEQLIKFKEFVEELSGNEITYESLLDAIERVNAKREAFRKLYELRKHDPAPISGRDANLIAQIAFYDDVDRFTEKVNELNEELEKRVEEGEGVAEEAPRILVAGTPMPIPHWKLLYVVESCGAVVVCEESCTGTRYFEREVSTEGDDVEDLIKNIAEAYMETKCAIFTPNDERVKDIIKKYKEWNCDGVILYNLKFCQPYAVEHSKIESRLREEGIPALKLESDYSEEDVEQLKTRIETFLESIA
ncbi:double-cubane-cluster-containing anaerobic reductase [Methanopyrus kandleri]|uniref:2-hydroxyacyl-CoA dehydratase subunit D n=1 Tax=Methanopyrus kandleri TaxID=2320 RepID=A0A832T6Q1_9EURY|nr:2-hydroxyacyl-CoA dehydratase subunit D [Methanopyrus kandleri]